MSDEFVERVLSVIAETQNIPREKLSPRSSFEELGIDSLGGVAMVADLETAFDVSIPNEEVLAIRDIGQAIECLRRHRPKGPAGGSAVGS
ncbi:MAG: phosphopantetheine-binding protein [Gemmatimonadaceae bacterium]